MRPNIFPLGSKATRFVDWRHPWGGGSLKKKSKIGPKVYTNGERKKMKGAECPGGHEEFKTNLVTEQLKGGKLAF